MACWWLSAIPFSLVGLLCLLSLDLDRWSISDIHRDSPSGWNSDADSTANPWPKIIPSTSLDYHPCYDGLKCARLEVPMNWRAGEDGSHSDETVAIAVVRRPAKVAVTDPRYGGAILVNPGGPAASGVIHTLEKGEMIQSIVDASAEEDGEGLFFDIIGFDPRSVGYSTPKLECFPDYLSRQYWSVQGAAAEAIPSTNASFASKLSHAAALTQSCVDRAVHHNSSIAYHLNTAPLVEDMVAIVERHGEWREKTTASLLGVNAHELRRRQLHPRSDESSDGFTSVWQRTKWNVGKEKLLYWGVSYGTVPGQLFAHMHPGRVLRVLLDGVVDVDVYLGSKWDAPIAQGDDVLEYFFSACSRSPSCKFGDGDEERTRARYEKLLQSLSNQPLPVASNTEPTLSADTITSSDVRRLVRQVAYTPLKLFPRLDRILVDLEDGNGTTMAAHKQSKLRSRETQPGQCGPKAAFGVGCHDPSAIEIEGLAAIMCSDNRVVDSLSDESFAEHLDTLQKRSQVSGWFLAELQMLCRGWQMKPKWHVDAPLHANTADPILFIGTTIDPVTPLESALKASRQFPGSSVLQQDSVGHISWSSPSLCTAKTIRAYFQTGTTPPPSTICDVDELPFSHQSRAVMDRLRLLSESDRRLLENIHELALTA